MILIGLIIWETESKQTWVFHGVSKKMGRNHRIGFTAPLLDGFGNPRDPLASETRRFQPPAINKHHMVACRKSTFHSSTF